MPSANKPKRHPGRDRRPLPPQSGAGFSPARKKARGTPALPIAPWDWKTLAKAFALALAVFAVYFPALHGGPLWDDGVLVFGNHLLREPGGLHSIWLTTKPTDYFPLTLTSYWLEWRLWEADTLGYHLVNVALHIASALLIWRLLAAMRVPGAYWAALLFALHPMNVDSVAWMAERKNTLSMPFYVLALLAWWRWLESDRTRNPPVQYATRAEGGELFIDRDYPSPPSARVAYWTGRIRVQLQNVVTKSYLLALVFFLCAMLAKTSVVMLPFIILLLAWWKNGRVRWREWLGSLPFFSVSLVLGLFTVWFQHHNITLGQEVRPESMATRIASAGMAAWFYLGKFVLPWPLMMTYPRWHIDARLPLVFLPLLLLVASFALLFLYRRRAKPVLFVLAYVVIALFPVLGFLTMTFQQYSLVADHFAYIAVPALTALLVAGIFKFIPQQKWALGILIAIACIYGGLAMQYDSVFINEETMWRDTEKKNDQSWAAYGNLGMLEATSGRTAQAAEDFSRSLNVNPHNAPLLVNRANAYAELHQYASALNDYEAARKILDNAHVHQERGLTLSNMGRFNDALRDLNEALKLDATLGSVYYQRALVHAKLGQWTEALQDARTTVAMNAAPPNFVDQLQAAKQATESAKSNGK